MAPKPGAKVIAFPLERRREQIAKQRNITVPFGRALTGSTPSGGTVEVTLTRSTAAGVQFMVGGVAATEPWMKRLPAEISRKHDDRRMWAKLGYPSPTAKRHRIVAICVERGKVWVTVACGRRNILTEKFDDAMSGGDCGRCRSRGWR